MVALYHRASGQTHVVASPVPEILEALHPDPLTLDALLAQLSGRFDIGDADVRALEARVEELVAAGLVEAL
ncbi:HPr-rel-A system PqqD family peptide chaperone [Sphingomonadaceae bacterium LXI357]|uniref:HPr-rel-A system PqqD family peptide chaperone n=2 Tax=Stakelama marina TaxID=2826939 RepID=A0A8T4IHH6_9SPHN|nr:HPr-rel-A system PqqD family peptide chaperone [Stakelama marina]